MKRIKVAYLVHEWTYAGTARSHLRILEALDRDRFEPYALVWDKGAHDLLPHLTKALGDHVIPYRRSQEKTGPEGAYAPLSTNLGAVMESIHPDIFHHARGGYREWPLSTHRYAPLQVETSVFGGRDDSGLCDLSFFISPLTKAMSDQPGIVTYIPVPEPTRGESFRGGLVPESAFVCGRIGRPANFHSIALDAFRRFSAGHPDAYFIYHSACDDARRHVESNNIQNVILLPTTLDDTAVSRFWSTLDVFCHSRSDGECFGLAIAEAMSYGIPVVSHFSGVYDAQKDTIGDGGRVCRSVEEYQAYLERLYADPQYRQSVGSNGRERARTAFSPVEFIRKIETSYLERMK